jgi:uncharacterized protein YaiL (DUF2058 family)
MGSSLFDQIKKSGLVDENKAKQTKSEMRRQVRQQQGKQASLLNESKRRAQQTQAEKAGRDRELDRLHKQAAEQKAIAAQIKQLIEYNRVEGDDGEIGFNFTDGSNVQRLYVTDQLRDQLIRGRLAIVKMEGSYDMVPAAVAEKIKLRDPLCVVLCNVARSGLGDADDPYADYQVPDDLLW